MKKFPLAALVQLRAHAVDGCRETLLERDAHLRKTQHAHALAERAEREHDAERCAVGEQEVERLVTGVVRARDLAQWADYERAAGAHALRLSQQHHAQAQKLQRAERDCAEAERALAEARAEQRVFERQQEQFVRVQQAQLDAVAEEEALEAWLVRKVQC